MSKLGATLKNKRETLGLDIDKITEDTRISADIIEVLEAGEYKDMPSYNHAKNFVKNYATYLKLEMDKVEALFDDECTKEDFQRDVKYITAPVTKETGSSSSGVKLIIPIIILIVIAFSGYKVFMAMQKGDSLKQAEKKTVAEDVKKKADESVDVPAQVDANEVKEAIEDIKNSTEAVVEEKKEEAAGKQEEKPAEKKPEPKKEEKKAEKKEAPVEKKVEKDENQALAAFLPDEVDEPKAAAKTAVVNFADVCWVHIKIDGKEEIDFIAEKGNQREIVFHDNFVMDIGNAAVVSISYNNRTIAGLGAYKQPVKGLKFTVNEKGRLKYTRIK